MHSSASGISNSGDLCSCRASGASHLKCRTGEEDFFRDLGKKGELNRDSVYSEKQRSLEKASS